MEDGSRNKSRHFWGDLTETELAPFRGEPIPKLLISFLAEERDKALEHIANCVEEGKIDEAKVTRGGLRFCQTLLAQILHPPERVQPEPEEEFKDPAALRAVASG